MEELITYAKNGNQEAFTELILNIQNDLYRIGKTRLNEDADIKDAIQETMVNAYNNLKSLKDISNFKAWIIKILINECNKIYMRNAKKEKLLEKITNKKKTNYYDNPVDDINSKINFDFIISNLNFQEKLIITLHYNSGYSCSEIADILNMNMNTVKSKLKRAKDKVRKFYKGGVFYE